MAGQLPPPDGMSSQWRALGEALGTSLHEWADSHPDDEPAEQLRGWFSAAIAYRLQENGYSADEITKATDSVRVLPGEGDTLAVNWTFPQPPA